MAKTKKDEKPQGKSDVAAELLKGAGAPRFDLSLEKRQAFKKAASRFVNLPTAQNFALLGEASECFDTMGVTDEEQAAFDELVATTEASRSKGEAIEARVAEGASRDEVTGSLDAGDAD